MKNKLIYIISLIIFVIDILSKIAVSNNLVLYEENSIISNFLYFTYTKNTGVAFSFLEGNIPLIIIITIVFLGVLIHYFSKNSIDISSQVMYGFILGGALGNFFDRVIYGYVIDFIDIRIFSYNYPIFNIADIFIVIGILLLMITILKKERSDKVANNSRREK